MLKYTVALMLFASLTLAQRTRPDTGVQAGESTYVFATIEDSSIILYAIYDSSTGAIRGYALWNDTESTARARLEFEGDGPIDLVAAPGTRAAVRTTGQRAAMTSERGTWVDRNVSAYFLGHDTPVDISIRTDRNFPLPRER